VADQRQSKLASQVLKARELLEREARDQLEGMFNILPSGEVLDESPGDPVLRSKLLDLIEHHKAAGASPKRAVDRVVRESAFTTLNRFAALKMAECRGIVRECVSDAIRSTGIRELADCAPGLHQACDDGGYRLLIESVMDEVSIDLQLLFDRRSPTTQLWPRPKAVEELLEILNTPDLNGIWEEDETIGWVYQHFNGDDAKKMRDASSTPRNSQELAVRNQYFTPRYVVKFLIDNSLGRIWFEMRGGTTRVSSTTNMMIEPAGNAPRGRRDPRDLTVLDPAVGSGHFLLYAYDLLELIYEESWSDTASPPWEETGTSLRDEYQSLSELRLAIPGLILRHNLFGVEIDARAAQIARLSLWMRAQRSYEAQSIPIDRRPAISRTNIAVAEPLPGDNALLEDFLLGVEPVGTLLRVEEHIRQTLHNASQEAGPLFRSSDSSFWENAEAQILRALRNYATDARSDSPAARKMFAEDAEQGIAFLDISQRRFDVVVMNPPFGAPSRPSKAYIDEQYRAWRYDLFPCFVSRGLELLRPGGRLGALTPRTGFFLSRLETWRRKCLYEEGAIELVADLGLKVLEGALVEVAAYVIARDGSADRITSIDCLKAAGSDKGALLQTAVADLKEGRDCAIAHVSARSSFAHTPLAALLYWAPESILQVFRSYDTLDGDETHVREGLHTSDNERFVRLWWEVPASRIQDESFVSFAKGGDYAPYYSDLHLLLDWRSEGEAILASKHGVVPSRHLYLKPGLTYTRRTASAFSCRPLPAGSIFSESGPMIWSADQDQLALELALLMSTPVRGMIEFMVGSGDAAESVGAARHFLSGLIGRVPVPRPSDQDRGELERAARECVELTRENERGSEINRCFGSPPEIVANASFSEGLTSARTLKRERELKILEDCLLIDHRVSELYGFDDEALRAVEVEVGSPVARYPRKDVRVEELQHAAGLGIDALVDAAYAQVQLRGISKQAFLADRRLEILCHLHQCHPASLPADALATPTEARDAASGVISYLVGCAIGRWDVRLVSGAKRSLPGVFENLPSGSPGMLLPSENHSGSSAGNPIAVPEAGILVEDAAGLFEAVRAAGRVIWGERQPEVEQELCDALGIRSVEEYLARPGGFFADHLKRYSKSRRKAPIYWPLSTGSGSYTVWIYCHRLTSDTLFRLVSEHLDPKIREAEEDRIRTEASQTRAAGREAAKLARLAGELTELEQDLREMKTEVLRVAELPYRPDLCDGVQITAAPLWKLFRLPAWRRALETTWKKLEKGEYDWAHLAYEIWPDRVRGKCKTDRSLAIAHDLEDELTT
jgi:hypothetical protein